MTVIPNTPPLQASRRGIVDRFGDRGFQLLTLAGALLSVAVVGAIVWKVFSLAHPAISHNGLSFLTKTVWDPVHNHYGALLFLYGTAVSSLVAPR
jgi:phosphate transport system permease protein